MPWSKYTCPRCGSVFAGTLRRTVLVSLATGVLGYIAIGSIPGNVNPLLLLPAAAVTLIVLFADLPQQIKKVGGAEEAPAPEPGGTPYFLTTERLGFRTWTRDDLELAVGLWGDHEVTRLFDASGPLSREEVRRRLRQEIASQEAHGFQYWPVFLLAGGEHVGCCGLRLYDPAKGILETGFHLRSSHWGQGYAAEAAQAVLARAFGEHQARALFAGHHPENHGSERLLLKLGFRYTHDEFFEPTGREHRSYLLTAEEYEEQQRR
jgi:RimJ/RimL family protein N-acetyltransferase